MNESIKKQVYETNEAIKAFPDTHFIDDATKKNIASFIYKHVPLQDELNILDAGVGDGDNFLIPLIKILEGKNQIKRINISVFDKSQELISKLKSNLVSNGFKESVSNTFIKNNKLQSITVTIDCFDLDLEIKYFENNREKYDVIISTYLLHHVLNWRFGVIKLLYELKQNGVFIVGQRIGSLNALLDGNLEYQTEDDCKTELDKIFYKFKKIKDKHFYWDPEISATNIDNLRNFVSPFFNEKKKCQRLFQLKSHKCNTYETLKNWFIKGVYTYLWSEGKIEKAEIENIFQNIRLKKKIPAKYTKDGHQIFILTEYSNITESQLNYWMTRPIIEKINNLNQLDINAFTKYFADLLATNSILFPTTKFISIHPWDIIKDGWATPVQILVNGNSFDNTNDLINFIKNYLLYLAYSLKIDYSFNNLIFKEAKSIRRIKIIIHNKAKVEVDKEKSEIICFKIPSKYQGKIKWNPLAGKHLCKDIEKNIQHTKSHVCSYFVTNEIIREIQNIDFGFNDKISYRDIINALKKSDVLNRELLDPVDAGIKISGRKDDASEIKKRKEKYEKDLDGIAHILVAIATYFLNDINDKDYKQEVFYEPSKVLYDHGAKKVVGFGGIIRFEDHRPLTLSPESTLNRIYNNLVKQRDTILYQLVNVLFCKIGVISWAEKMKHDVYKQQLKTAIISILIDSYAHNISAHSLAALKWWIELRHKMLDKRFEIKNGSEINCLQPSSILFNKDKSEHDCKTSKATVIKNSEKTTLKYYEALGLKDSTYNQDYYSLFDFLQFADTEVVKNLFRFENVHNHSFHPRFPVPIDYALFPFFRFLRDKGAFWSGVTRDMAFGGESKTWYKILWEDFANNPLYLGTIAKSEGITKININLDIKQNGKTLHKGRFVTIDMSVIDYEEKLSQDPNLNSEKYQDLLNNTVKEDSDCIDCKNYVSYDKYSKYAFVKLGKCFAKFREILDNEEYSRVFLPGGIVGEHALFTIFENTIRNIKHYKDPGILKNIQTNGIDFWISIEEDELLITKKKENKNKSGDNGKDAEEQKEKMKPELFKVGVWLGHETKLIKKEETKNNDGTIKEPAEHLLFNIIENTLKPILDIDTGAPRMGGNSQDKACAAMLFNNKFSSVERRDTERDKQYFPWIEFKTLKLNAGEDEGIKLEWNGSQKVINKESEENYKKNITEDNKGYLKKYFYLWRGEDVLDKSALDADDWENPARAKFLVNDQRWKDEDIIKARKNGIIRLLDLDNFATKALNKLYKDWLEKWLGLNFQNNNQVFIGLQSGSGENSLSSAGALRLLDKTIVFYCSGGADNYQTARAKLKLAHGQEKEFHCNVRSHGAFIQKFFKDTTLETIGNKKINVDNNNQIYSSVDDEKLKSIYRDEALLLEFLESILSKVVIFDNRVNDRFNSYSENKKKMLEKDLFLEIYKEDKDNWKTYKSQNKDDINFLILHLSFIESLGYKEDIEKFINDELCFVTNKDKNFIFVVTSGRGRKDWEESIKTPLNKKITIFKPIESILNSIENGISYNDHFDIKYYLIKTLIGS